MGSDIFQTFKKQTETNGQPSLEFCRFMDFESLSYPCGFWIVNGPFKNVMNQVNPHLDALELPNFGSVASACMLKICPTDKLNKSCT